KASRSVAAAGATTTGGARAIPTRATAAATRARARDAEPADVEKLLWAGRFAEALDAAPLPGTAPGLLNARRALAEAGRQRDAGNYGAARFFFDKASKISPDAERIARYWRCTMYRLENRNTQADECFKDAGIDEGEATRHK